MWTNNPTGLRGFSGTNSSDVRENRIVNTFSRTACCAINRDVISYRAPAMVLLVSFCGQVNSKTAFKL